MCMTFALLSYQKQASETLSKCYLRNGEGKGKLNVAQEVAVEVTRCNIRLIGTKLIPRMSDIKCGVGATHGSECLTIEWRLPF